MTSKPDQEEAVARRRLGFECGVAVLAIVTACAGCSSHKDTEPKAAADVPHDVTLTQAQRPKIHLYTVATSSFHKTVETTGVVDFDNDHATSVLAPFAGPVSRLERLTYSKWVMSSPGPSTSFRKRRRAPGSCGKFTRK